MGENVSYQFDRLPETGADREVEGRATRQAVVEWWTDRFGVPAAVFEDYTFWEKGKGGVWALAYDVETPVAVESLGMKVLRTRHEHWKPTTDAAQRFGRHAARNVIHLDADEAARFLNGETFEPEWDGDWGYLIAAHDVAGEPEPIGIGLYVHDEFRSMVPKGRQRDFTER